MQRRRDGHRPSTASTATLIEQPRRPLSRSYDKNILIYHETIIRMHDVHWVLGKMIARIRVFRPYPYPKTWWLPPVLYYHGSPHGSSFYWMPHAWKPDRTPGFQTLLLHFDFSRYGTWTTALLCARFGAVDCCHTSTGDTRLRPAVMYLHHKILRRVTWNGQNICQDNAYLGTCVIITKLNIFFT